MVKIIANVKNSKNHHEVILTTGDNTHSISIPPKASGFGSSSNGGELLFLALATCYCNDIYREADKREIRVTNVHVEVEGDFGSVPGNPATNIMYHVTVEADTDEETILDLISHTDTVAEIQNTVRQAVEVVLGNAKAISIETV